MSEDFRPTASADAQAESMAAETPFVDQHGYNTFHSHPTTTNMPESSSAVAKTPGKVNQTVGQSLSKKLWNIAQVRTPGFYKALVAEFMGTLLLVLVGTSTGLPVASKSVPDINGALASGLTVATVIVGIGYISGAHINPAITVTFLVVAEIDLIRAVCYIIVQLLGAISGSAIVRAMTPDQFEGKLGMTLITNGVSLFQAFIVEFFVTFILCYTVHAICDRERDDVGGSKALAAGFATTVGCLFGGPYTGAAMNPARSFGPALMMNDLLAWTAHRFDCRGIDLQNSFKTSSPSCSRKLPHCHQQIGDINPEADFIPIHMFFCFLVID